MIGYFNSDVNQSCMKAFCESYNLSSLIKEPTCYKNPQNPSCIDLILTNLKNSCMIQTGLPDFHKMTVTVMKKTYEKLKPRTIIYLKQDILKVVIYIQNLNVFVNQSLHYHLNVQVYYITTFKYVLFLNKLFLVVHNAFTRIINY